MHTHGLADDLSHYTSGSSEMLLRRHNYMTIALIVACIACGQPMKLHDPSFFR